MRYLFIISMLVFSITLSSQPLISKNTSVTVYNSNIGIVREARSMVLPKGNSTAKIVDVAQMIDPTTVRIKFDGEVLEQNYQYDLVSMDQILQRYIDKDIQLINDKGELFEGILLSCNGSQVVIKKKDGNLLLLPNIGTYRIGVGELPQGLITRPTLVCLLNSNKQGQQDLEMSYQTSGLNWHAEYVAILNDADNKIDMNSWVSIQNTCGTSFQNAEIKVIAGDVNLVNDRYRSGRYNSDKVYAMESVAVPQFEEKSLFEYHIYTLQRKSTIANNESKQISLFEKKDIKAVKKFIYSADNVGEDQKVNVQIVFENKESNNIGVPMPKGKVRIFKASGSSLEFIGEDQIDHTAKDETVKLNIGSAFDIKASSVSTNFKKISEKISEMTYKVTVKNHKAEDIEVYISKYLGLNGTIRESDLEYKKVDAANISFSPKVKANSDKSFSFTVRFEN